MNTIQIQKVLSKRVKYFQGVYPVYILPSTIIKLSVTALTLISIICPVCIWYLSVFPTLVAPNILIRTNYHHSKLRSWLTYSATQYLGHLNATDCRVYLRMSADITAACTPSTEPGDSP